MLPLYLSVVSGCRNPDPVIYDVVPFHSLLEQRPALLIFRAQCGCPFRTVICLDFPNRKRKRSQQIVEKLLRAVCAVFFIQLSIAKSRTFVDCSILIILFSICYTSVWHILYINLNLLTGIFRERFLISGFTHFRITRSILV